LQTCVSEIQLEMIMIDPIRSLTRRQFGFGLCGLPLAGLASEDAAEFQAMPWNEPASVAKVYVASAVLHWPKPTLDLDREMKEVEAQMAEVARKHARNVRFTGATLVRTAEEAKAWRAKLGDVDGVLIIPLSGDSTNPLWFSLAPTLRTVGAASPVSASRGGRSTLSPRPAMATWTPICGCSRPCTT
jgi:hypothetical protein